MMYDIPFSFKGISYKPPNQLLVAILIPYQELDFRKSLHAEPCPPVRVIEE